MAIVKVDGRNVEIPEANNSSSVISPAKAKNAEAAKDAKAATGSNDLQNAAAARIREKLQEGIEAAETAREAFESGMTSMKDVFNTGMFGFEGQSQTTPSSEANSEGFIDVLEGANVMTAASDKFGEVVEAFTDGVSNLTGQLDPSEAISQVKTVLGSPEEYYDGASALVFDLLNPNKRSGGDSE